MKRLLPLILLWAVIGVASATVTTSFSATPTSAGAGNPIAFTDTSTGSPSEWGWFFGDNTYKQVWTLTNASSDWPANSGFAMVTLADGRILITGGDDTTWGSSDNGNIWTEINASSGWEARKYHSMVALPNNHVVITGGYKADPGHDLNDTWRSTDGGNTWEQMNASSGWAIRETHTTVVASDGSIILTGGLDGVTYDAYNDTWRSTDEGATWNRISATAGWEARSDHSIVLAPDGSIILTGGVNNLGVLKNDTWKTTNNGLSWTEINASSGWVTRFDHSMVSMPDKSILLIGGWDYSGEFYNDTWRSIDSGTTWDLVNSSAAWFARINQRITLVPNGNLVLVGGMEPYYSTSQNDVWNFNPTGSNIQNPSHSYTQPGTYSVALIAATIGDSYGISYQNNYITISSLTDPPIVSFTKNISSGYNPRAVQFNDTSLNAPTEWHWTAANVTGNNTEIEFASTQNPVNIFQIGNWSIRLNATNIIGSNTTAINQSFVNVSQSHVPFTSFTADTQTGASPLTVVFTDTSLYIPTEWYWSFTEVIGNNTEIQFSTNQNPTKIFGGGNFSIRLDARNEYGANKTSQNTFFVNVSDRPIVSFTKNVSEGTTTTPAVQFNDTSLNAPTEWHWTAANVTGNNTEIEFASTQNPVNIFQIGNWSIRLNATNAYGSNTTAINQSFVNISQSQIPAVSFTASTHSGVAPLTVYFTDTSTNTPTEWNWTYTNVTGVDNNETIFSTGKNPYRSFGIGNFSIRLNATNAYGSNTTAPNQTFINVTVDNGQGGGTGNAHNLVYYPHQVMITAQDFMGNPIKGMTVSVLGSDSTANPAWFTTLLGIDLGSTPITSTTMQGLTGDDGAVTFLMIESEEYQVQFTDPALSVSETHKLYPSQAAYKYTFWTQAAVVPPSQRIAITLWNQPNGTDPSYTDLGMYYSDTGGTTTNLTFQVQNEQGVNLTQQFFASPNSQNVSYRVLRQRGVSYVWSAIGNSTRYPRPLIKTDTITFTGSPKINFDLDKRDLHDNVVGTDWNSYICLAIIFTMAFLFGRASIKYAMAVVPLMTLFFWWIGLLTGITPLLMATVVFLGILFYFRFAEQESDI